MLDDDRAFEPRAQLLLWLCSGGKKGVGTIKACALLCYLIIDDERRLGWLRGTRGWLTKRCSFRMLTVSLRHVKLHSGL